MSTQNQNQVCNNPAYLNAIDQNKLIKIFNDPPVRYEIIFNANTNPYLDGFTKHQLDMRRKAEILQYAPNKRSQTNKQTRAQLWAQIVNGQYSRRTYPQSYIQNNLAENGQLLPCPTVYTPTSASDVPGENIMLYQDDSVPLYNFNQIKQFSVQDKPISDLPWEDLSYSDVYAATSSLTNPVFYTFSTLRLLNVIRPTYTYTMDIPLSVYIQADVSYNGLSSVNFIDPSCVQLWLSSAAVQVYYSKSPVQLLQYPSIQMIGNYNVNQKMRISTSMTIYPKSNSNYSNPTKNKFFAYGYFGILRISNLRLQAQENYIYNLQLALNFNSTLSPGYTTYFGFSNPKIAAYINTSYTTTQRPSQNCFVANPVNVTEQNLPKFSLSSD